VAAGGLVCYFEERCEQVADDLSKFFSRRHPNLKHSPADVDGKSWGAGDASSSGRNRSMAH